MASAIAMMIGGALTNALAFTGSNFIFSQISSSAERKRHDLAIEKLQHERDLWNQERLKRLDYINEKLREQGHAERTFKNVDEALQQYYFLTGENLEIENRPEPQLSDFLSEDQTSAIRVGELALILSGLGLTGYLVYKFI